jgi:outer membrane protein TolC
VLLVLAVAAEIGGTPADAQESDEGSASRPESGAPGAPFAVPTTPDSAFAVELAGIEGVPLSVEEAVGAALSYDTDVREAEAGLAAARGTVKREKGTFDPTLFATTLWSEQDLPTASFFAGADVLEESQTFTTGGARIKLWTGTELAAALESRRFATNSTFAFLVPERSMSGLLSLRQPVLKGFGPSAHEELSAAERLLDAALARYDDAVLSSRARTEQTYWDLYAAIRDLAVQRRIRSGADGFLTQARLRAQGGLVGPNEVANARVFLADQEEALLDREENADLISDQLASLMGRRPAGAPRYRTTDEPARDFPVVDADLLVTQAVERNLELKAAGEEVDAIRALARGAAWDALPRLDLIGSIGGNGLAGDPHPVVFDSTLFLTDVHGDFGDAWDQVSDRKFPTWSAGFAVEIPIPFREGRGERDRLRAEVARAEQRQIATRLSLEEDVRASHRELAHAMRRLEVAQDGAEASYEQVRIGQLEYTAGRTTAFELVRLGADLAEAQQRYSQALVRTAKAAAELRRLTSGAYPDIADDQSGNEDSPGGAGDLPESEDR